jgi:hypothetical protein
MPRFYQPDLGTNPDDPFARGTDGALIRRSFWLDMGDAALTNDEKRAHLADIGREHLIDEVCVQEYIPPE